ncbi:MAG: c-type cytochrome [Acidimicrobiia bacterium]
MATVVFSVGTGVVYAAGPSEGPVHAAPANLDGRSVFLTRGCIACHQGPGVGGGSVGPDLTAVSNVADERVPGLGAEAYVRQSIRDPRAFVVPGFSPQMPTVGLSDDEIEAVVSFLLG